MHGERSFPFARLTWAWLAAVLLATGCGGYKLGPTGGAVAGGKSLQIGQVVNATDEPRLSEAVSRSLRQRIQQDGTFKLATHGDPNVVVTVELRKYDRIALSFQAADVVAIRDYDINLMAHVVAIDNTSGTKILDREVLGHTTIRSSADLGTAERENTPDLADSLARNIVSLLAEGTW